MEDHRADTKYTHGWWKTQIEGREKHFKEEWFDSAEKILKIYLDKRDHNSDDSRYNLFWSNTTILKAALYAQKPKVSVERQWQNPNDPVAALAALMLKRCLQHDLDTDKDQMHQNVLSAVFDYLVTGGGNLWVRYAPDISTTTLKDSSGQPITGEDGKPMTVQRVVYEDAMIDYVSWKDMLWSAARRWTDVRWVAKRVWLTKKKYEELFGAAAAKEINEALMDRVKKDGLPKGFTKDHFEVFEIYCKDSRKVYHMSKESVLAFKETPYTLDLPDFWPCPAPLLSNLTNEELLPTPDYKLCQDKYEQLNQLDARIHLLEKALRVAGYYDKNCGELKQLLSNQIDNIMVPVDNWAVFAEKGAGKGVVDWFPVEQIGNVLVQLIQQKSQKVQELYELTGLSDIMRGSSNPNETLGAQELKAQYGSVRLQDRQLDVAKFVRDLLNIKAQIIMRHYQPETILKIANITDPNQQPYIQPAIELLKNPDENKYRIEINEDSLAMPDYNQERDSRVEFMTMVGQFISQASPLVEMAPPTAPILGQMIKWAAAGFRGAAEMEATLDQLLKTLMQTQEQSKDQGPSPEQIKAQTEQIKLQQAQLKLQGDQMKFQADQAKAQADMQLAQMEQQMAAMTQNLEVMKLETQKWIAQLNNDTKIIIEQMKLGMQAQENQADREHDQTMTAVQGAQAAEQQAAQHEHESAEGAEGRKHETEITNAQNKLRSTERKTKKD